VLRNSQQVDDTNEAAAPRKLRRDIREADLGHFRDDVLARVEHISASDLHMWSLPQAYCGGDLPVTDAIAECLKKLHVDPCRCQSACRAYSRTSTRPLFPVPIASDRTGPPPSSARSNIHSPPPSRPTNLSPPNGAIGSARCALKL